MTLIALAATVILTLSSTSAKLGDPLTLTATVTGPYVGTVCAFIGEDDTQSIVGQFCFEPDVDVKQGTEEVKENITVPATAPVGAYSFMAVLPSESPDKEDVTSPVVHLNVSDK